MQPTGPGRIRNYTNLVCQMMLMGLAEALKLSSENINVDKVV